MDDITRVWPGPQAAGHDRAARVLVLGAGTVARAHAHLLAERARVDLVDPISPGGPPPERVVDRALQRVRPSLVVVAVPPRPALALARAAARTGAHVLLEKPGLLAHEPAAAEDERIVLAAEAHLHPTAVRWLAHPPRILHAELQVRCWRPAEYYRGWRRHRATGGGLLQQQAYQSLSLLTRMHPPLLDAALSARADGDADVEHALHAHLRAPTGMCAHLQLRADDVSTHGDPHHALRLHTPAGPLCLSRPLAGGLAHPRHRRLQRACRARLHAAAVAAATTGTHHPGLYPLAQARALHELIGRLYRAAEPPSEQAAA